MVDGSWIFTWITLRLLRSWCLDREFVSANWISISGSMCVGSFSENHGGHKEVSLGFKHIRVSRNVPRKLLYRGTTCVGTQHKTLDFTVPHGLQKKKLQAKHLFCSSRLMKPVHDRLQEDTNTTIKWHKTCVGQCEENNWDHLYTLYS